MKNFFSKRNTLSCILLFLICSLKMHAALSPGDIAVIGYKAEPLGEANYTAFEFTFILLANVNAGEAPITFTDHGWIAGALSTNVIADGYLTWTPTSNYSAGTIINVRITSGNPNPGTFTSSNANFTAQSTVASGWTFATVSSSGGDQVLVFQGTIASPTFIYGFTNETSETQVPIVGQWQPTGGSNGATNSELPLGLINGTTAVAHTNDANLIGVTPTDGTRNTTNGWSLDNLVFTGPFVANKVSMLANIGNQANWNGSETTPTNINIIPGGGTIPTTLAVSNIVITDASNNQILSGGPASAGNNTSFGTACVAGGLMSKTYTIKNAGFSDLTLTGTPKVVVGGAGASSFSVTLQPTSPIVSGGSTTVTVQFDPTTATNLLATLTIANNDATKNPFVINISGDGASPDAAITSANTVCQGAPLILSAPNVAGNTYNWSGSGVAATNTFINNSVPAAYGSLTYSVTVTDVNNCVTTGTKTVTVNPKPVVTISSLPTLCYGQQATLTANCIMNVSAILSPGANASTATGYVYGTYNTANNQLDLTIVYNGLTSNITNSHIHAGAVGVNGGVIVPFAGWPSNTTSGSFTYSGTGLPAVNLAGFLAGNTYVNIHSVNFPGGEIRGQLIPVCSVDTYAWNTGDTGATLQIWPAASQSYTVTGTNSTTGCSSNPATSNVTVTPITLPTASFTSITKDAAELYYFTPNCDFIATVIPNGGSPVAGNVVAKEWLETTPPFSYVPRHYEITPANNPNGVSGTITLYFSQADFDAYNSTVSASKLPTNGSDAAGIANFQIAKFSGTSPNGLPGVGGYTGTPTMIPEMGQSWNTAPYTMVFEDNIWKVTFPVTSFSGFIATSAAAPLPINLISFTGKSTDKGNELKWKTSAEQNFSHFEIEKSPLTPGGGIAMQKFEKIGKVLGNSSENYEFLDEASSQLGGLYRLKMLDIDGKFKYSKIIAIVNNFEKDLVGQFYPNPSQGKSYVEITALENGHWTISTFDLTGKILSTESKFLQKGLNKVAIEKFGQGVNFVRFENDKISEIRKMFKN